MCDGYNNIDIRVCVHACTPDMYLHRKQEHRIDVQRTMFREEKSLGCQEKPVHGRESKQVNEIVRVERVCGASMRTLIMKLYREECLKMLS